MRWKNHSHIIERYIIEASSPRTTNHDANNALLKVYAPPEPVPSCLLSDMMIHIYQQEVSRHHHH